MGGSHGQLFGFVHVCSEHKPMSAAGQFHSECMLEYASHVLVDAKLDAPQTVGISAPRRSCPSTAGQHAYWVIPDAGVDNKYSCARSSADILTDAHSVIIDVCIDS